MADPHDEDPSGLPAGAKLPEVEPPPDFLAGVQSKIHKRSGGKFYRSRWATSPMSTLVQIVSLVMLLAIVLIWLLAGPVSELGPDTNAPGGEDHPRTVKIQSSGSGSPESPPSPPPR